MKPPSKPSPPVLVPIGFSLPSSYEAVETTFGHFEWHDIENSLGADVTVEPGFVARNIFKVCMAELPKPVYLHKKIARAFGSAIRLACQRSPGYKVTSCASFVPRHKRHDRDARLSLHSWGIAFDVNPATNPYGAFLRTPCDPITGDAGMDVYYDLPVPFIETMEEAGFVWGGRWKKSDPMHFQAAGKGI